MVLLLPLLLLCKALPADEGEAVAKVGAGWAPREWNVQTSVYTRHFDPSDEHNNHQHLIGLEARLENGWLVGASSFDNSYDQPSEFVYMGRSWAVFDSRFWYVKLLGGLVHGYDGENQDKIPLNGLGVAPAILPALGFRYHSVFAQANLGGVAVVVFTLGMSF